MESTSRYTTTKASSLEVSDDDGTVASVKNAPPMSDLPAEPRTP